MVGSTAETALGHSGLIGIFTTGFSQTATPVLEESIDLYCTLHHTLKDLRIDIGQLELETSREDFSLRGEELACGYLVVVFNLLLGMEMILGERFGVSM